MLTESQLIIEVEHLRRQIARLETANRQLQALSITDELTGVHNRRYFNQTIKKEWYRAVRDKKTLTLIMLDIDFFKAYNDYYGHVQGDECLRKIAAVLGLTVRRSCDFPARYGGEEFAVLLPGTGREGGIQVAESIRQEIENMNLPHCKSSIAAHVTVSLGLSSVLPLMGSNPSSLVKAADNALYEAKKQGRNRIVMK